jgi:formylglycine-generating enzyme required for sulfatase activity
MTGPESTNATRASTSLEEPWPGLLTFSEADRHHFRGRQTETEELHRLVMRERLTVFFGLSGLGKSSLLQAGLFPRVRQERVFPVYIRFDFTGDAPNLVHQVHAAIVAQAAGREIEVPPATPGETLWEYFHRVDNIFWDARNEPVTPLLVVDQFEELFTLGRATPGRVVATDTLIDELADLVEGRAPSVVKSRIDAQPGEAAAFAFARHQYKVLISIREDFLADLETLRPRMPAVGFNRLRLQHMNGAAALLVVNQAPQLIDAGVAERVVRFVAAEQDQSPLEELKVEPALLSVVCRELNKKRAALGEARISADLLAGSQEQVLSDFYERSTADLPVLREFIEDRLLTGSGYRDSVALENALATPGITADAIDLAVERRLLRREDRGDVPRLELTHDLLSRVVRASRNNRRQREEVERQRVVARRAQEEKETELARAREEAEQQRKNLELKQQQVRVFRAAAAVSLVMGAVAIGAASWAYRSEREAVNAKQVADSLRKQAQLSLPRLAQRLQQQAWSRDGSLAVVSALEQLAMDQGAKPAVALLDDATLQSNVLVAVMAEVLDTVSAPELAPPADSLRSGLLQRVFAVRKIGATPTRESDETLNRRIAIAGGSFTMGSPAGSAEYSGERPPHTVTLRPFLMQEHEVTNGEYRRFDPSHNPGLSDDLPAVDVSWYDAMAYAVWLGGMLPTEAQWEFAARGASGRMYPWGNDPPTCDRANSGRCRPSQLRPVKLGRDKGKTPEGIYDLAGNAFEWCRDWYAAYPRGAQSNPLGPASGTARVVRGGSFNPDAPVVRAAFRSYNRPEVVNHTYGFRVVWPAPATG